MSNKISQGRPFVLMNDKSGFMELYTHDGHKVQCGIFLRVTDSVDEPPKCIAKFEVNIVGGVDEMIEAIKNFAQ